MRKADFCYEQNRKRENMPNQKTKRPNNNFEPRNKNFRAIKIFGHNNSRNFPNKKFQGSNSKGNRQQNPTVPRNKEFTNNNSSYVKNNERKEPIKCLEFQGPHYALVCPNRKKTVNNIHDVQEETKVGDLARGMPKINATLKNKQDEYQTSMVEVEGMLNHKPISILIDPRDTLSYVSPSLVQKSKLPIEKFSKSWLVQLATGEKIRVIDFVKVCTLFMNQFETFVKLNVLPLGPYYVLIGMDWLEQHQVVLNCFDPI